MVFKSLSKKENRHLVEVGLRSKESLMRQVQFMRENPTVRCDECVQICRKLGLWED